MRTERDSLKETIEELHCVQAQEGQLTSGKIIQIWAAQLGFIFLATVLFSPAWIVGFTLWVRYCLVSGLFPLTSNDGSDSLAAEITTPEIRYDFRTARFVSLWWSSEKGGEIDLMDSNQTV